MKLSRAQHPRLGRQCHHHLNTMAATCSTIRIGLATSTPTSLSTQITYPGSALRTMTRPLTITIARIGFLATRSHQLLLYTLAEVSSWYNDFYVAPKSIAVFQYYQISTAALARVRTSPSMIGYKVFDIDTRTEKRFVGSFWVDS